jgi:nucleotide-binding universal stress UspA family protein
MMFLGKAMNTIVAAIDLDASSRAALQLARTQARLENARLLVLHVVTAAAAGPAGALALRAISMGIDPDEVAMKETRHNLDLFLSASGPRGEEEEVRLEVGSPADVIVAVAKDVGASCIVLGTHGRSRLGLAILGSVARGVMTRAHCRVIAVHEPQGPEEELA